MSDKCTKCKKDLGGFLLGEWRYANHKKYCLECAETVKEKTHQNEKQEKERIEGKNIKVYCPSCDKNFAHLLTKDQIDESKDCYIIVCPYCEAKIGKRFAGDHLCSKCGKYFKSLEKVKTHQANCKGEKEEACTRCGLPLEVDSWYYFENYKYCLSCFQEKKGAATSETEEEITTGYRIQCHNCLYEWDSREAKIPGQCPSCHHSIHYSKQYSIITRYVSPKSTGPACCGATTVIIILLTVLLLVI